MKKLDVAEVSLTVEQWDLVVLCLKYVHARAHEKAEPNNMQPIDIFARKLVRRRVDKIVNEIQSNVPEAGEEE